MKLTTVERSGKPEKQELKTNPMVIWLSRTKRLEIAVGDQLARVAEVIEEVWGLGNDEARQLAAFWFAIGERLHTKKLGAPWSKAELSTKAGRRYLMK